MDEVIEEALEKHQGLVPLVYDAETMALEEARPQDMQYAVYLRREADKVIAELEESHKKEVGQLLMAIVELKKEKEYVVEQTAEVINGQERELRHYKYKRCLAMARIALDDWHLHNSFYAMGHQEFEKRKCEFYEKLRNRWLKIAEKFKTNSTINRKEATNAL